MKVLKKIITFILMLIVTISTLTYIIIKLINNSIMNETYILSKLNENDYYEKTYDQIESNFENYLQQSGLDEEVLKNIITKEQIKKHTQSILTKMYDGTNEEISTEQIKTNLNENIKKSLGNRKLTPQETIAIEQFVNVICDEYQETILNTGYEQNIFNIYQKINKYIKLAQKAILLTLGISIILIIIIRSKRTYKGVSCIGAALLSTGVLILGLNLWIKTKVNLESISILNEAFSEVIKDILQQNASELIKNGIIFTSAGLIMIIIPNIIHNIKKYKRQK